MSDSLKTKLVSALNTFLAVFISTAGAILTTGAPISWTLAFWSAVGVAAVRAAIKAVIDGFTPVRLGGRKA